MAGVWGPAKEQGGPRPGWGPGPGTPLSPAAAQTDRGRPRRVGASLPRPWSRARARGPHPGLFLRPWEQKTIPMHSMESGGAPGAGTLRAHSLTLCFTYIHTP